MRGSGLRCLLPFDETRQGGDGEGPVVGRGRLGEELITVAAR